MKYGLIVHFETQNLGDDIQAYATEKFLPHTDYLIDREHLDSFYTKTGERVAAILSGWYLHKPLNWPPSPFLKILPISFHITTSEGKKILTLTDYGANWLRNVTPIGCRDRGTMRELKRLQIESYLSGCITLTLNPFADVEPHGKIVLVDLSDEVVEFIRRRAEKNIVIVSHDNKKSLLPKEAVDFAAKFKNSERLPTSHYPEVRDHCYSKSKYPGTWNYRRALVEGLLKFYQGASLVVTSRLSAALPCLALGTPVLLLRDAADLEKFKFSTYLTCLNCATPEDLLAEKFSFDFNEPLPNPKKHKRFTGKIQTMCTEFIAACESSDEPPIDFDIWFDAMQKSLRLKKFIKMFAPGGDLPIPRLANEKLWRF